MMNNDGQCMQNHTAESTTMLKVHKSLYTHTHAHTLPERLEMDILIISLFLIRSPKANYTTFIDNPMQSNGLEDLNNMCWNFDSNKLITVRALVFHNELPIF